MPRPGFVLEVDRSTPPILFHHGEGFRLEKLPGRSQPRAVPGEPLDALEDPDAAIRHALDNPLGDSPPLRGAAQAGHEAHIAFDDISLPLPPMRRPDVRQRVIEAVLDLAAAAGVDDVHLIAALALHRRMTEAELRHAVGDRVYDAFAPHGLLYNHDAEDPDGLAFLGETEPGRGGGDQQAGRRERPPRLREHQPRLDGRRLEVHRHRPGLLPVAPPPPQRADDAAVAQLHGPPQERAPQLELAHGRGAPQQRREGVPDRDHAQQRHVRHVRPDVGAAEARVGVDRTRPRRRSSR